MPYSLQPHLDITVAHYTRLALSPGWRAYTRHRLQEMERSHPELYAGLIAKVSQAVADSQAPSASPTAATDNPTPPG